MQMAIACFLEALLGSRHSPAPSGCRLQHCGWLRSTVPSRKLQVAAPANRFVEVTEGHGLITMDTQQEIDSTATVRSQR